MTANMSKDTPSSRTTSALTSLELERYDRQLRIARLGVEGQRRLKGASVLVAGVGGLGCSSALGLAMAGVGRLVLVDRDRVELSNLNRQALYSVEDLGRPKAEVAARRLRELNPEVEVEGLELEIGPDNVEGLVRGVDLVVDGQDNFETRLLLNDECLRQGKPFIHAAIYGMEGRLMTVVPGRGPCLRCLVPSPPPPMERVPALGATVMAVGALQAAEAVKLIAGVGEPMVGYMLVLDLESMEAFKVQVRRNPKCPACSTQAS